jgi:SAM-dependent methyltransferase
MHQAAVPYRLNSGPYTSHTLLLAALPAVGAGRTVLDVGCSDGYLGEILSRRGYVVTGIDLPRRDRDRFPPSVRLIEADLDAGLPPLDGKFDYVVCADVLEHLSDPAGRLFELCAALRDSGRLIASLPNSAHAYFRWNVLLGRFPRHDRGLFDRTHLHFYNWPGWVELFASAGLSIESLRSSGVPVGLALPRWKNTLPVRILERISFETARWWKTMFAYQFIVTARPEVSA